MSGAGFKLRSSVSWKDGSTGMILTCNVSDMELILFTYARMFPHGAPVLRKKRRQSCEEGVPACPIALASTSRVPPFQDSFDILHIVNNLEKILRQVICPVR
jgi:hypothetical protein